MASTPAAAAEAAAGREGAFGIAAQSGPHYGATAPAAVQRSPRKAATVTPRSGTLHDGDGTPSPRYDVESIRSSGGYSSCEDPDTHEFQEIEESTYYGTMATMIKDLYFIYRKPPSKHKCERFSRIAFALLISLLLISCQLYVLVTIKTFVTSPAVRGIRNVYDEYQKTMYHGRVRDSGYGFSLGIGGPTGPNFDPAQFSKLSNDMKGSVCLIPFSQPGYLSIILLVWCLSVIGELRSCLFLAEWLYSIPRVNALGDMIITHDRGEDLVIVGLPVSMKSAISVVVLLPRTLTAFLLLWLGCRWLTATLDFTEVLINAIALEFVIKLNEVIYTQLISDRSKRDNRNLKMDMPHIHGSDHAKKPHWFSFIGTMAWAVGAVVWIYVYIVHLQMVLPGYQWDVRGPCTPWVQERFNFWRI